MASPPYRRPVTPGSGNVIGLISPALRADARDFEPMSGYRIPGPIGHAVQKSAQLAPENFHYRVTLLTDDVMDQIELILDNKPKPETDFR